MKMRLKFNAQSIKDFLISHIEKIVLAVVVVLAGWIVASGYGRDTPKQDMTPESLADLSNTAQANIKTSSWAEVAEERVLEVRFGDRAAQINNTVARTHYMATDFKPPLWKLESKRVDPKLMPVKDLVVRAIVGPMAQEMDDEERLLRQEEEEEKSSDFLMEPGATRLVDRQLWPEDREKLQQGYGASRGGGGGMGIAGNTTKSVGTQFVSLTGLVPVRQQDEEYEHCFLDAMDYNEGRDHPQYVYFYVQKQEIYSDGSESDWKTISTRRAIEQQRDWVGFQEEIADQDYVHPTLTYPIPPVMMRDPVYALHPEVPREPDRFAQGAGMDPMMGQDSYGQMDGMGMVDPDADVPMFGGGSTVGPGGAGPFGGGGGGIGGRGRPRKKKEIGIEDSDDEEDKDKEDDERRTSGTGYGMGGIGQGSFQLLADDYMFRFIDFGVEQGKAYRYRVQLMLEDPNDPRSLENKPLPETLNQEVITRLKKKPKPEAGRMREFWVLTDWSEPSAIVHVPTGSRVLVGPANKRPVFRLGDATLPRDEPSANVMAVVFDQNDGMDVPGNQSVYRGSVVNFNKSTDAIDPIGLSLESKEGYSFVTNQMVADLMGGDAMHVGKGKDPMVSTTEMLLFDESGNLYVRTELGDYDEYDRYDFEEPEDPNAEEGGNGRRTRRAPGGGAIGAAPAVGGKQRRKGGRGGQR